MEMNIQPKFEHSALELDIERLSEEIKELKEKVSRPETSDQEMVKSVIKTRIQNQPSQQTTPAPTSGVLPKYLDQESPEVRLKVEELIDLAFHKGIDASVSEAKKYGPFILDALHDSLTGKIYEELKARKLL